MSIPSLYKNRKVALLGLGLTGHSLIRYLKTCNISPICWDDDVCKRTKFKTKGVELVDLYKSEPWKDIDLLIISPGIHFLYPEPHPVVNMARENSVQITTDIDLFFENLNINSNLKGNSKPKIICITGSNGKSTTTALIHHMLSGMSKKVEMGGNIGRPVMDLNLEDADSIKVIELSSYQIEIAGKLEADIAIFLNFSNDHLTRHGGLGGYFFSKARLFLEGNSKFNIIGIDQKEGRYLANFLEARYDSSRVVIQISTSGPISGSKWSVFILNNFLIEVKAGKELFRSDLTQVLQIPGQHNKQNVCASYAACRALGVSSKNSFKKISGFKGLPHRTELVRKINEIVFVNDSKATNMDSVKKSLSTFSNIRWIAGGLKKDGDNINFKSFFPKIKKAYLIGTSAADFSFSLKGLDHEICNRLDQAVRSAYEEAKAGDTILLAPGCASFDQFESFEERGDKFRKLVNGLS